MTPPALTLEMQLKGQEWAQRDGAWIAVCSMCKGNCAVVQVSNGPCDAQGRAIPFALYDDDVDPTGL